MRPLVVWSQHVPEASIHQQDAFAFIVYHSGVIVGIVRGCTVCVGWRIWQRFVTFFSRFFFAFPYRFLFSTTNFFLFLPFILWKFGLLGHATSSGRMCVTGAAWVNLPTRQRLGTCPPGHAGWWHEVRNLCLRMHHCVRAVTREGKSVFTS